jgi:hypothetical protein
MSTSFSLSAPTRFLLALVLIVFIGLAVLGGGLAMIVMINWCGL